MVTSWRAAWALVLLGTLAGGCTLIASAGRDGPVACAAPAEGEPDPCPPGQECRAGICQDPNACEPSLEICNGEDDDCDGAYDEGFDSDGDGWSSCDLVNPANVDCVDTNPAIHPPDPETGEPREVCDGSDNDCDTVVDEAWEDGTQLCGPGEGCFPDQGGCVFIDCRLPTVGCPERHACEGADPAICVLVAEDCTMDGCAGGEVCDPISLSCITPRPVGAGCNHDAQCESGHCFNASDLRLTTTSVMGANRICSAPCCSNSDCASDQVCWASGSGARGCVPQAFLATGSQGAPTSTPCTSDVSCVPESCGLDQSAAYEDATLWSTACVAARGSGNFGQSCSTGDECRTGLCIVTSYGARVCTQACGSQDDCPREGLDWLGSCSYRAGPSGSPPDWIQVCDAISRVEQLRGDALGDGENCSNNGDCLERACLNGQCARTCCSDDQCSSGRGCQPVSINGRIEMHCAPRDT